MIVLDIACDSGHRFEGWFANAESFEAQREGGLVACTTCGTTEVERALSVPRIGGTRSNETPSPKQMIAAIAAMQAASLKDSTWVGRDFASRARSMAEGTEPTATIHGQATPSEAQSLRDDGIAALPLLCPVVPPEQQN